MAVSLLAHEVSDLCIGKPPLRPLPISATAGDVLVALRACAESYLSVWDTDVKGQKKQECVGKVSAAGVICFLCDNEKNLKDPRSALKSPVSDLLRDTKAGDAPPAPLVRRVEAHSSILEALDVILDGAQNLVVPIRPRPPRRKPLIPFSGTVVDFCCLTQEDLVRFFLNSIGCFSPIPALSVSELGLIRTDVLAVRHRDPALVAAPLLKQALLSQTAVAVLTDDGKLIGEISPSTLAFCPVEAAAAAVAALSAGELMAYVDYGCCPPDDAVRAVRARLLEKGLDGMVELMDGDLTFCLGDDDEDCELKKLTGILSSSSSASSGSSSSSDEESSNSSSGSSSGKIGRTSRSLSSRRRPYTRSGSYSSRMGRRSEEAIVCHPGSSLVAVIIQALAHRVSYVWVVEDDYQLAGIVTFPDILHVFRDQLPSNAGSDS